MNLTRRAFVERGGVAAAGAATLVLSQRRLWASAVQGQAPVQSTASPPAASPTDRFASMRAAAATTPIKATKLRDTVFLLQGVGGNMVAHVGPDGKLLIDSSLATAATRLKHALAELDANPLKLLINTHWHFDHTDGNAAQHDAGAFIMAHTNTRVRLSQPQDIKLFNIHLPPAPTSALPQQTFDEKESLFFNNDELSMVHLQAAHTDSDIYIFLKNQNLLHTGDIWFNGFYPVIDEGSGGTINGMIRAAEDCLAIADDKTKIVPGHGPLGDKAGLAKYRDMLATVATRIEKLKASGQTIDQVNAARPTADFDEAWGNGMLKPDVFVGLIYRTLP